MQDSAGATSRAYETMTTTTEHAKERMQNSFNNLSITIGNQLNPAISGLYNNVANVVDKFSEFTEKHPAVTAALSGVATYLGVAAIALTAYTAASKIATIATEAFTVACDVNPIILAVSSVAALTAGVVALTTVFKANQNTVKAYNGTLKECANEINNTEAAYQKACELYGENSSAAQKLSDDLDTLEQQYEQAGGAAADFTNRIEENSKAIDELIGNYNSQIEAIDSSQISGQTAIAQLQSLSEKTIKTSDDLDYMRTMAEKLNNDYHMNIVVDYDTGDVTGFDVNAATNAAINQAEQNRKNAAIDFVTGDEYQKEYLDAKNNIKGMEKAYQEAQLALDKFNADEDKQFKLHHYNPLVSWKPAKEYDELKAKVDETKTKFEEAAAKYDDLVAEGQAASKTAGFDYNSYIDSVERSANGDIIADNIFKNCEKGKESVADLVSYLTTGSVPEALDNLNAEITKSLTPQEISAYVFDEYYEEIENLCTAYDDAYNSALQSFQGQFGLFDEASNAAEDYEHTINNVQTALDSQLEYWQAYQSNIETMETFTADKLGVSQQYYDDFMAYIRTGTPEAASLLNDMVDNLNTGNDEAVRKIIETKGKISDIQKDTAEEVADWEVGYTKKLDDLEEKMSKSVEKMQKEMDFSDGAVTSAKNTLDAYIKQIQESGESAVTAAQHIADRISNALSSAKGKIDISTNGSITIDDKKASGGIASGGLTLVGEEGPELIWLNGGEMVYNNSDTNRIISALSGMDSNNAIDGINTTYNTPESGVVVNLSVLDNLISKIKGDEIINYSNISNAYDSTYNADYSRRIDGDTVYGDDISNTFDSVYDTDYSRAVNPATYYGDNVKENTNLYMSFLSPETSQINRALELHENDDKVIAADDSSVNYSENSEYSESVEKKEITININGEGGVPVTINGSMSKEEILETILECLKPTLINVLSEEILEEGDSSYDY